jgi:hypothetical protein
MGTVQQEDAMPLLGLLGHFSSSCCADFEVSDSNGLQKMCCYVI